MGERVERAKARIAEARAEIKRIDAEVRQLLVKRHGAEWQVTQIEQSLPRLKLLDEADRLPEVVWVERDAWHPGRWVVLKVTAKAIWIRSEEEPSVERFDRATGRPQGKRGAWQPEINVAACVDAWTRRQA